MLVITFFWAGKFHQRYRFRCPFGPGGAFGCLGGNSDSEDSDLQMLE